MSAVDPPPPTVPEVLSLARASFSLALRGAFGNNDTMGTCLFASWLVRAMVTRWIADARVTIRGGDGHQDGGCLNVDGILRGHYWAEIELPGGERGVADITADQFGHPPIRWVPFPQAAAEYRPGDQATVDASVQDIDAMLATSDGVHGRSADFSPLAADSNSTHLPTSESRLMNLPESTTVSPVQKCCPHCGSSNITADGPAAWDVASQAWVIATIYDGGVTCNACGAEEIEAVDRAVADLATEASPA
ncbi:hypothetical protein [Rhodanobacter sp. FW106-PBR-LB-2-11]|uniref:hypothetical protein n=1 Tax=Rhodanobacter sp. FW106-PBR-LB-2-11 TaxID=1524463 RepID=UPI0034E4EB4A